VEAAHQPLLRDQVANVRTPEAVYIAARLLAVSLTISSSTKKPKSTKTEKKLGK
jgi:hypothetical protein